MLVPILLSAIVFSTCALFLATYEHFHEPHVVYTQSEFCPSVGFQPMLGAGFGGRTVEP
jgi:hypothetical protein